jgi:hypothetical protein
MERYFIEHGLMSCDFSGENEYGFAKCDFNGIMTGSVVEVSYDKESKILGVRSYYNPNVSKFKLDKILFNSDCDWNALPPGGCHKEQKFRMELVPVPDTSDLQKIAIPLP